MLHKVKHGASFVFRVSNDYLAIRQFLALTNSNKGTMVNPNGTFENHVIGTL